MTQTSATSKQAAPETDVPERARRAHSGSLVSEAMQEYLIKSIEIEAEHEQRASDLLARITDCLGCVEESNVYSQNERVFCELEAENLTLEFFASATPEQDFFLIYDYMGLLNARPIRNIYDLGQALDETSDLAAQVLHSFRQSMTGMVPLNIKELAPQ